jgi:uncharacterized DUF497 family protein
VEFEWDEEKRLSNIEKHGVDFEDAQCVFDGRFYIQVRSTYAFEERFMRTGILDDGRFVTVIWTARVQATRIISARSARDSEKRKYRSVHG